MNKNSLIIGVVVLVLLALGAWFMANRRAGEEGQLYGSDTEMPGDSTGEEAAGTSTSLKTLLAAGTAQQCSFQDTAVGMNSEGVIYVAGGKVRGNFMSTVDGQPVGTHMIVDGKTSYVWTDASAMGFKTTLPEGTTQPSTAASNQTSALDVNKTLNYSCQPWTADNSVFTLPSGVQFNDLSTLMGGAGMKIPTPGATGY